MRNYAIALLAVAMLFVAGCTASGGHISGNTVADTAQAQKAPSFTATTSDGKQVSLDSLTGEKGLVVYFMASWCSTCAKNWAAMNEVIPKYADDVNVVAISVDPTDSADVLSTLAAERGFVFDTVPGAGNSAIVQAFGVQKQTAKFAIDKNGNIVDSHNGALDAAGWEAFLKKVA